LSTVDIQMEMQRQMLNSIDPSSPLPAASSYAHSNNNTTHHHLVTSKHNNIIPSTLNYTSYLKHVSHSGTFSEIVSVMAPCPWTYLEIAQQLSTSSIHNEIYSNWVKFYSSEESCKQVDEIKQILNILGRTENEKSKGMMKNHFTNACRYEYLFWEMAYNLDRYGCIN
jgi:thiaminase